jgi:hypothetical protein
MSENAMDNEVISAFVDNESFDPLALARLLAEPAGRDLLLDLIALRHVVLADGEDDVRMLGRRPDGRWMLAAAAALLLAIGGGYGVGTVMASRNKTPVTDVAPAPTRVVDLKPGVNWNQRVGGG